MQTLTRGADPRIGPSLRIANQPVRSMKFPTIAAISTPIGTGGIGIVRISGSGALSIARQLFRGPGGKPVPYFDSHRFHYGFIHNPEDGEPVDEVLLVWMAAPKTYTREDIVEIHTHGGLAVQRKVLELATRHGAALAEPGEFTKRAFLNGRIDLTQAEGVIDLIHSKSRKAASIAVSQVAGQLKARIQALRETAIHILTQIEAAIDFPEDVSELLPEEALCRILDDSLIAPCRQLIRRYDDTHVIRDGIRVIIIGRPNVGKSSLLNRLLEKDRAIVTPIPGTTRDFIEEHFDILGIPVLLMDTAGIHDTDDPVEKFGIERAYEKIRLSDIVLWVTDSASENQIIDGTILDAIQTTPVIRVVNKIDLIRECDVPRTNHSENGQHTVETSALHGWGIDRLKQTIAEVVASDIDLTLTEVIPNVRHREALAAALDCALRLRHGVETALPAEMLSMDTKEMLAAFDGILGLSFDAELLDRVFERFCIGK